jgi:hypothetical protein
MLIAAQDIDGHEYIRRKRKDPARPLEGTDYPRREIPPHPPGPRSTALLAKA